jgi:hypothetical protein
MVLERKPDVYFPVLRGKQYELVAIRENAALLSMSHIVPIVEPVREEFRGLERALIELEKRGGRAVVVVNPNVGDHSADDAQIRTFLSSDGIGGSKSISVGFNLTAETSLAEVARLYERFPGRDITLVHCGFSDGRSLADKLIGLPNIVRHVFMEPHSGMLYRKHFKIQPRILIRDGFQRRPNRDYPEVEPFSDLHVTFKDEGMDGFGDFLTVGDDYFEGGGPAYAIVIHLTFIDADKDEAMFVYHFKSDRADTPTDPAGKFAEALSKLVREVNRSGTKIKRTSAVREFLDLNERRHFPGLGYVKKLSMQHHLETLSAHLNALSL